MDTSTAAIGTLADGAITLDGADGYSLRHPVDGSLPARAQLVATLTSSIATLAAEGDIDGARVAADALSRLLG